MGYVVASLRDSRQFRISSLSDWASPQEDVAELLHMNGNAAFRAERDPWKTLLQKRKGRRDCAGPALSELIEETEAA